MDETLAVGSVVIIDGVAWTVAEFRGHAAGARHDGSGRSIWFDSREATVLGAGLWGLPGRIEPPAANPDASVVTQPAEADLGIEP